MAKPLLNIKLQRAISRPIFDRFSKTWHRFDQGKEFFKMSIYLVHYTFYLKNEFLSQKIYQGQHQYHNESGLKNTFKSFENQ